MSKELMTVEYTELDNGLPALVFCNDFIIAIKAKTYAQTYVASYDNELLFNLKGYSHNGIKLTFDDQSNSIQVDHIKLGLIGYVDPYELYQIMSKCLEILIREV